MVDVDRRQDLLTALEQLKAAAIHAEPKELPGLIREQRAVLKELETLGVDKEASTVDDLRARRAARRAASGL